MSFTKTILYDTGRRALVLVNLSAIHSLALTYGFSYAQNILLETTSALQTLCSEQVLTTSIFTQYHLFYVRRELHTFYENLTSCLDQVLMKKNIGWGIGIVEFEELVEEEIEDVFRYVLIASDVALETESKCCLFTREMQEAGKRRDTIIAELTSAIREQKTEKIHLQYQPILTLETNQISELEVLCRFESDSYGTVWPDEFIPLAEMTRLIIPLGAMIFQKAFQFYKILTAKELGAIRLSINVSVIQLLQSDFLTDLNVLLNAYAIEPSSIILEVTESCIIPNYQEMNLLLSSIQSLGIGLAVDDFGTGYSSLAHEEHLCLDTLKIDKTFIEDLVSLPEERTLVHDIISMGHRLGRTIIAEGVETDEQRSRLQQYDCDKIQGYLVSKPLDSMEIIQFLAEYHIP